MTTTWFLGGESVMRIYIGSSVPIGVERTHVGINEEIFSSSELSDLILHSVRVALRLVSTLLISSNWDSFN